MDVSYFKLAFKMFTEKGYVS